MITTESKRIKEEKKEKKRSLHLEGLGARRVKKKGPGLVIGSNSWYTGPGAGQGEGKKRRADGRGLVGR